VLRPRARSPRARPSDRGAPPVHRGLGHPPPSRPNHSVTQT
jgi:hypothetical protein